METLGTARALDALGMVVLPANPRQKAPLVPWRHVTWEESHAKLEDWFKRRRNVWVLCGARSGGLVVVDCDNPEAVEWWSNRLGELLWQTTRVKTKNGLHFWFQLRENEETFPSWNHERIDEAHRMGAKFDVRCDGGGVVAPPSVHESGHVYTWERGLEAIAVVKREQVFLSRDGTAAGGEPRSTLAQLLVKLPDEGSRNDWLSRVAGHYAKMIPHRDAYDHLVFDANDRLDDPLNTNEVSKVADSIWRREQDKPDEVQPDESNGWIVARSGQLWTKVRDKDGDHWETWADFEPRVVGVVEDEAHRAWIVDLFKGEQRIASEQLLEDRVVVRNIELEQWLAARQCHITRPARDIGKGNERTRLAMYLDSQKAPVRHIATSLGWHDGHEFLTLDGCMTPEGLVPAGKWTPDPRLKEWAPYRYGFEGTREEALAILREVLTFHEYKPTAVVAAWMAALTMKGHRAWQPSLFPYLALEAPSESGKTKGAFAMLAQLFGYKGGPLAATFASFRDTLTAHRSGIVWVDDLDDPVKYDELLRQVTVEGSTQKKSVDNTGQETRQLVGGPFISGESLGSLMAEKAQRDRSIRVHVNSPRGRRSKRQELDRPQWDDITEVWDRYGSDLTRIAGWIVSAVIEAGPKWLERMSQLRGEAGRYFDNMAIVQVGARILSEILNDPRIYQRVDRWVTEQENTGAENILTHQILPTLLAVEGIKRSPIIASDFDRPVAVWVSTGGEVWFSPTLVSDAWFQRYRSSREDRNLTTEKSLRSQWEALNCGRVKLHWTSHRKDPKSTGNRRRYYSLDTKLSYAVLDRAGLMAESSSRVRAGVRERPPTERVRADASESVSERSDTIARKK